jgi:hypothetical protein
LGALSRQPVVVAFLCCLCLEFFSIGPATLADGDSGHYPFPNWRLSTGIAHVRSHIRISDITDGTSNTYLVGEKYVGLHVASTGASYGDDQGPYVSDERDSMRWGSIGGADLPPMQDKHGLDETFSFGSAHPSGFQMALADGSVRGFAYSISPQLHRHLCNRRDGQSISFD